MKRNIVVKLCVVAITVVLTGLLLAEVDLSEIIVTLQGINPLYIILGFVFYLASHVFRATRFYFLLGKEIKMVDLFSIVCVHNFVNNIFPAKTGELSYIYLIKRLHNKSLSQGAATLGVARLFDLATILIIFILSISLIQDVPVEFKLSLWIVGIPCALLLVVLFLILFSSNFIYSVFFKVFEWFKVSETRAGNLILSKFKEIIQNVSEMRSSCVLFPTMISSILIWSMGYLIVFFLLVGMHIHLPFSKVIIAVTVVMVASILPIQGVMGFGTTETIWTTVFVLMGVPLNSAIVSAFGYHIIQIIYFILLGCVGFIGIPYCSQKSCWGVFK